MTITLTSTGALASNATTITPAYGTGVAAGRLAVLTVTSGSPTESIPSTPSGWTLVDSISGGGGTFGSGTGPRRVTWFVRVLLGSDAAPTTVIPTATGTYLAGRIQILQRSAGTGWRWFDSEGSDTSSGTGFAAVCNSAVTWAVGDFVVMGYAVPVSTATFSAEAVTATGVTFGTVTEASDDQITALGNKGSMAIATCSVTAGPGTQIPTVAATLSAAGTGAAGLVRFREASAAIAITQQATTPPRNVCTVTGMLAEQISSASIYEVVGSTRIPVRAATAVAVSGADTLLRVDAEQPFGVAVTYQADLTDANGNTWTVAASPVTSTVSTDIVSDAINGIGAAVQLQDWPSKDRTRETTLFNVGGRMVGVSKRRSGFKSTISLRTEDLASGNALEQVLDGATEGVLQIRSQVSNALTDCYVLVTDDSEAPQWINDYRFWSFSAVEAEGWPLTLEAAGFTLADINNNYTSLQDINNANATLLALALRAF
jgi:hypothetical protein